MTPEPTDNPAYRGLVLGTEAEASTPLGFSVWVDPGRFLQLDDVVTVRTTLPDGTEVETSGIVDDVRTRQEGVSLTSDVSLARDGVLPAQQATSAHVSVTRVEPEVYVPPMPGQPVVLAEGAARDRALFFDRMVEQFPLGLARDGSTIVGNLEFLDGAKGAHVNISGISGVATKTSYATFLLYALFEGASLRERRANAKALIFNVKGEDLLFLDRPNVMLTDEVRERYASLGLPAGPFGSAGFYAPVRRGDLAIPDTGSRQEGVTGFFWTLREFCEEGFLPFLFTEADAETSQMSYVIDAVAARLAAAAKTSPAGANVFIDDVEVEDFDQLLDAIDTHLDPDSDLAFKWAGSGNSAAAIGTIRAFMRRLHASARHVGTLVRGASATNPEKHRIAFQHQVTVVDLHRLHDRAQRFVVGVLLRRVMEERESRPGSDRPAPFFVVVDELNKYAPRTGRSPIKDALLDIAERGRSLGVILIGAQQTASEVEPRIVANAAFRVVGRLDPAEAQRNEYRYLTPTAQKRAALLKPGSMIVAQPEIPVPLLLEFPWPAWATRAAEVAPPGSDGDTDTKPRLLRRFDIGDPED
ncbi:MAG: ATP-binding protein [Dehalococcoidia bacterium]|nr:MAG: ATP-binding protein [Dehalococcoidia bacterium]